MKTTISLVLTAIPVVLAGTCSKGWDAGKGPWCTGGSYGFCIQFLDSSCWGPCNHPLFGLDRKCHAFCSQLVRYACSGRCASVSNCSDCMNAVQRVNVTSDPESGLDYMYCSKEGCKFSINLSYKSSQSLTVHFSGPLFLWLRSKKLIV